MDKKILVLLPSLARGGVERTVSMISEKWAVDRDVIVAVFNGRDPAFPVADSVRTVDLDCPVSSSRARKAVNVLVRARRLSSLIRRESPDRIISFMESSNFPAVLACIATGRLRDLTISVRNNPSMFPKSYRLLMPLLYRWPGRIVTASKGVRHALIGKFHIAADKVLAIPNPIDADAIRQAAARAAAGQLPERPFVLGVGRLVRQKGFDMLIRAFHVSGLASDQVLVILGEGPERQRLRALVRELDMEDKVLLPGSVASPVLYMSKARCFVLSSRHEGWGNVIMEAMACGCPVIAFDCPYGPSEIIEDGQSGILVDPENIEALARAMDNIVGDEDLRARLVQGGRLRVDAFDTQTIAQRWLESR